MMALFIRKGVYKRNVLFFIKNHNNVQNVPYFNFKND